MLLPGKANLALLSDKYIFPYNLQGTGDISVLDDTEKMVIQLILGLLKDVNTWVVIDGKPAPPGDVLPCPSDCSGNGECLAGRSSNYIYTR